MKNRYLILLAGLLVAGSMLLVACGDKNDKPADTKAPTAAQTDPATDPAEETTAPEADTTVAEDDTTVAEDDTTVAEDDTTVAEDDTTVAEDDATETEAETDPVAPGVETMVAAPSAAIPYAGFTDCINGFRTELGWDTVYGYTTLDESGNATYIESVREGVTTVDGKINLLGGALVNGGQDGLFYSVDGMNWVKITEVQFSSSAETLFALWALKGGVNMENIVQDNAFYNAVIDLSAHAGETVDVYVAVRSAATHEGAQQLCHLFTFNDVTVA